MMKQMFSVKLWREDNENPWGFRLEGGVDIGHLLNIQHVKPNSIAERSGLRAGDLVVRINSSNTQQMRHEDAKMEIIRSANDFEMWIERLPGGYQPPVVSAAKIQPIKAAPSPKIVPAIYRPAMAEAQKRQPPQPQQHAQERRQSQPQAPAEPKISPMNHTSLKSNANHFFPSVGVSNNVNPVPFGQAPPAPGETIFNQTPDGRTQRIIHNDYNTPIGLYSQKNVNNTFGSTLAAAGGSGVTSPPPMVGQELMRCGSCGKTIIGVFVKVHNTIPMHPECLKCCKCGIGLRNVGYFYIKDALYCDTHARQAVQPPAQGMRPVAVYK